LPLLQVRIDDLVDVGVVDVGVPDALRIDDRDRPAGAAVEAARLVDPDPAWPASCSFLTRALQWSKAALRIVVGAARLALSRWLRQKKTWRW
jgi:hypothetical protein